MRLTFRPTLVNGPAGDPALFVRITGSRRSLLFDLGDLAPLSARQLLTISHVFVSHGHIDHFVGFDRLLRVLLGRGKTLNLFGPEGFIDQVVHKLGGYTWNLVGADSPDFRIVVTEVPPNGAGQRAQFRIRTRFEREELTNGPNVGQPLMAEPGMTVHSAALDHYTTSLAFALSEPEHLGVWPNRLADQGLMAGDWLATLKAAVRTGQPEDHPVPVTWQKGVSGPSTLPLGDLRDSLLSRQRGQKLTYVTDVRYTAANADRIVELADGSDKLYIETAFREADAERAAATGHLTARQAGAIARRAQADAIGPFHFSSRYAGQYPALEAEAWAAFRGEGPNEP